LKRCAHNEKFYRDIFMVRVLEGFSEVADVEKFEVLGGYSAGPSGSSEPVGSRGSVTALGAI